MERRMPDVLGVDIGQVLVEQECDDPSLSFKGENYLHSPEMPHASRVLRRLSEERFGGRVHLITRCPQRLRERRIQWLRHHDFFRRVGIPEQSPTYCWNPHYKSNVCYDLNITHFVDDDPRELLQMEDLIPHLVLFRPKPQLAKEYGRFIAASTTKVDSWREIEALLLPEPTGT